MKPGDIRIRVSATGVYGSDIHMWKTGKGWNPDHKGDKWATASSSGRTYTAESATCVAPARNSSAVM